MRDFVSFFVNGKQVNVSGATVFKPLTDYLREDLRLVATKVVCAEGDCGACTIFEGRLDPDQLKLEYKPINACIKYVMQMDGSHVVTVEGISFEEPLNAVQKAMVDGHGAQCGFCTPGFIMAMSGLCEKVKSCNNQQKIDCKSSKEALTGNLCRCTGYEAIINSACAIDLSQYKPVASLYPDQSIIEALKKISGEQVEIKTEKYRTFLPTSVEELASIKEHNKGLRIISGGTDLGVVMNKMEWVPEVTASTVNLKGAKSIVEQDQKLIIGSNVTLSQVENYLKDKCSEFSELFQLFGSPQIRYAGTLVGNIANASPIADTPPFLFVMDAELEIASKTKRRMVPITKFYKGYKDLDLNFDEVIASVHLPLPKADETIKLYKISRRIHLDISSFTAAFRLKLNNEKIEQAAVALGGVGPVVVRVVEVEKFLNGASINRETFKKAGEIAAASIKPISDVRGSDDFRLRLSENIFQKLFFDLGKKELCR